mgnify:CR=1 FL=1
MYIVMIRILLSIDVIIMSYFWSRWASTSFWSQLKGKNIMVKVEEEEVVVVGEAEEIVVVLEVDIETLMKWQVLHE